MADDYNVLKENNLRQLVEAYEAEQYPIVRLDNFQNLIRQYTAHKYRNKQVNLIRKYAWVYDAEHIDTYEKATPLPRIQDIMNPKISNTCTYEELKALAALYPRWRQK